MARKDKRRLLLVSSIVGATSLATGLFLDVIDAWEIFTRNSTNSDSLQLETTSTLDDFSEWHIPASAIGGHFPIPEAGEESCGPAQEAWLKRYGSPLIRRFHVDMFNSAEDGVTLSLTDFRPESSTPPDRGEPRIRVICDSRNPRPATIQYIRIEADKNDSIASQISMDDNKDPAERPVAATLMLEPGESQQALLEIFSRYPASGRILVSTIAGNEKKEIPLPGTRFSLPPLLFSGEVYLVTRAKGLECERIDEGFIQSCTISQVQVEAAEAMLE